MNIKEKLKNNPKNIVLVVIFVLLAMLALSILKAIITGDSATASTEGRKNYTKISSVPGISFEVSQDLANYATAVMEISKDIDFIQNASYSYKNGTDTYMLFNMSQYVIVAKRGTSFDLHNTDLNDSLNSNSLGGIWFSNGKIESKDESKMVCDVTAQVVITNTIYNDFYGKLATITSNGEEWSLFVGSVNAEDSNMNSMIEYTIATFVADASNVGDNSTIFEVEVSEKPVIKEVVLIEKLPAGEEAEIESSAIEESESLESSELVPSVEPTQESTEDIPSSESPVEPTEPYIPVESDEPSEPTEVTEYEPNEEIEEFSEGSVEEGQESIPEETPEETNKTLIATNNQLNTLYSDDKAYTSSIYSMLDIGKIGYMTASNQQTGTYEEIFIRVEKVNDTETTEALIADYIASGQAYYNTMEAPKGTHWESITYSVRHDAEKNFYTNIQFVGLDGEKLKHRGIAYSMRTYDVTNRITAGDDNWTHEYVTFYAVPNGCTEYAIACGDAVEESGHKAYYKVDVK